MLILLNSNEEKHIIHSINSHGKYIIETLQSDGQYQTDLSCEGSSGGDLVARPKLILLAEFLVFQLYTWFQNFL